LDEETLAELAKLNDLARRTLGGIVPLDVVVELEKLTRAAPPGKRGSPDVADEATGQSLRKHALLADVAKYPISTVTERYERLGWNPKVGNAMKDQLFKDGLVGFVVLPVPNGKVKLLTLTKTGEDVMRNLGIVLTRAGAGGLEHEFWRARLKERCQARGYSVSEEYSLDNGKRVDLRAVSPGREFLIEIETGKSNIEANIEKCAGHPATVVLFFTNQQALAHAAGILSAHPSVIALCPNTLSSLHDLLLR